MAFDSGRIAVQWVTVYAETPILESSASPLLSTVRSSFKLTRKSSKRTTGGVLLNVQVINYLVRIARRCRAVYTLNSSKRRNHRYRKLKPFWYETCRCQHPPQEQY